MKNFFSHTEKKLLVSCYSGELDQICKDKLTAVKVIENFYTSYSNFNVYLKILIVFHLVLLFLLNFVIFTGLLFLKYNNFNIVFKLVQKIPFIKNIHNFIIANLLLHFERSNNVH